MSKRDEDVGDIDTTLFAVRLNESNIQFWRQLTQAVMMLVLLGMGFCLFGGVQYWICYSKDPSIGLMECLRGDRVVVRQKR